MEFKTDIFKQFDQEWGLVTAGDSDSFTLKTYRKK